MKRVLAHPFFAQAAEIARPQRFPRMGGGGSGLSNKNVPDGAATLTAITAASIAAIVPLLPKPPRRWIVAGGGAQNLTLLKMLAQRLAPASVETANAAGWNSDAVEAQAFAYMAVRHLRGLPITFPTTTGVRKPMQGGVLAQP